jgi:competence protein ComEC
MAGMVGGLRLPNVPVFFWAVLSLTLPSVALLWKGKRAFLLCLFFCFFLGYWRLHSRVTAELPENHVSRFIDHKRWHMIGTVDSQPEQFADRTRFVLKAESIARKSRSHKITGMVRVTVRGRVSSLSLGDQVSCLVRLKEIRNFNNPGSFDYRRYLAFQNIFASASVSPKSFVVELRREKNSPFSQGMARSRGAVSALVERGTSKRPKEVQGVMKALLTGDRSALSQETRDIFSRIGTAHLLAISGLHVGIVATMAFWFFRLLLGRSERVLLAAWATKGAALLSLFPVLFYGLLAGMSPSTQRAVVMVAVLMMGLLFERERDSINTLAIAALVILIVRPPALFTISFQLSFTAVLSILYMLDRVSFVIQLKRRPATLIKRVALFLCASASAILGTFPIALYYFNQVSLVGILTNCFMVPLIGFIVVPLGLLSALFLPLSSALSIWFMKGAALILAWALELATFFSKCPFAAPKTVTPALIEIGLGPAGQRPFSWAWSSSF